MRGQSVGYRGYCWTLPPTPAPKHNHKTPETLHPKPPLQVSNQATSIGWTMGRTSSQENESSGSGARGGGTVTTPEEAYTSSCSAQVGGHRRAGSSSGSGRHLHP